MQLHIAPVISALILTAVMDTLLITGKYTYISHYPLSRNVATPKPNDAYIPYDVCILHAPGFGSRGRLTSYLSQLPYDAMVIYTLAQMFAQLAQLVLYWNILSLISSTVRIGSWILAISVIVLGIATIVFASLCALTPTDAPVGICFNPNLSLWVYPGIELLLNLLIAVLPLHHLYPSQTKDWKWLKIIVLACPHSMYVCRTAEKLSQRD
ncbi:hypothetical protein B0I35DRAFT_415050 [Stachybotrys elegans]|uniref:Rhodopsin domain-containing protein n=1 Tax=Stachybotrys elegans TaxID=80388 RepID=A0A8K0WK32_9HYPO|nr:hypothetical protein B0I35DRAFT_415050 [Stachybotrys elegans]